jgi:hypothetical protein
MGPLQSEPLRCDRRAALPACQEFQAGTDTKARSNGSRNRFGLRRNHFLLGRANRDKHKPGAAFRDKFRGLASRKGVSAQAHGRNDLDELDARKARLQQLEEFGVTAHDGDSVIRSDQLIEYAGSEVASGNDWEA